MPDVKFSIPVKAYIRALTCVTAQRLLASEPGDVALLRDLITALEQGWFSGPAYIIDRLDRTDTRHCVATRDGDSTPG